MAKTKAPAAPKGPRKTDTRVAGALRIARAATDVEAGALVLLLDREERGAAVAKLIAEEEERHVERIALLRARRDFAAEVDGLPAAIVAEIRGAIAGRVAEDDEVDEGDTGGEVCEGCEVIRATATFRPEAHDGVGATYCDECAAGLGTLVPPPSASGEHDVPAAAGSAAP